MPHWLRTLLKAGVTFGVLLFLLNKVDLEVSVDLLAKTDIGVATLSIIVLVIQVGLGILRWHLVMIKKEIHIPVARSARYLWLGSFFNQVLPSSVGGDAVRGYCLVREGLSLGRATLSILLDRILGMVGLLILISMVTPYAVHLIDARELHWGIALTVLLVTSGLASILFMDFFTRALPGWRVMRGLTTLASDARQLLLSRMGLGLSLLSVVIHVVSIVAVGILSWALSIEVAWLALAVIVPITTLLVTVPVSIAGWGIREGVMLVGLGYAGIGPEQALALSILYGLSLLAVSLPGGAIWLLGPTVRSIKEK